MTDLTGVLILEGNKTYGIHESQKQLYKCIPTEKTLFPCFYIPYEIKQIGFSKLFLNQYVTFQIEKYNIGRLTNTLGATTDCDAYIQYMLITNNLQIGKKEKQLMERKINENTKLITNNLIEKYNIENRMIYQVFSIDGETTRDYDDAIGVITINDKHYVVSTYIANVPLWLTELKLWDDVKNRVSSIYLPDKVINMLPNTLANGICSLVRGYKKYVLAIDFEIKDNQIIKVEFKNAMINIYKNHVYESANLLNDANYQLIYDIMSNTRNDIYQINNSEDLIAKMMILTNYYSAKTLKEHNVGIFKSAIRIVSSPENNNNQYGDLPKIFDYWKKCDCKYETENTSHDILGLDSYIHITSPIRRLVDILNMMELQKVLKLNEINEDATQFCDYWKNNIPKINEVMKKIKKIQNNSNLLYYFLRIKHENLFEGYVLEKCEKGYLVYIPLMQMVNLVKTPDVLKIYEKRMFKIFVFTREVTFKQKIQLQLMNEMVHTVDAK